MSIERICDDCGEEYDMRHGKCPVCSHLPKLERKSKSAVGVQRGVRPCQQAVSAILMAALQGSDKALRYEENGGSYIRWGLVEKRIHEAIQREWPNVESSQAAPGVRHSTGVTD